MDKKRKKEISLCPHCFCMTYTIPKECQCKDYKGFHIPIAGLIVCDNCNKPVKAGKFIIQDKVKKDKKPNLLEEVAKRKVRIKKED